MGSIMGAIAGGLFAAITFHPTLQDPVVGLAVVAGAAGGMVLGSWIENIINFRP